MKHKIIFIVFDGLGDRPLPELDHKTPLEAANTPNLDALAKIGINGLLHTIERSIRPGSDVAHLSLFGYDPRKYYRGRGVFEATGIGIDLQKGDVAFRGNVATVDENGIITDRRAGRIDDVKKHADLLNGKTIDDVEIIAKAGVGHRIAVVLRGHGLSDEVTDTDPHKPDVTILQSKPIKNDDLKAQKTADILNKLTILANESFINLTPGNCLLLRGAGMMTHFPDFKEQYGLSACCIAGGGLYKGIAKILGMTILDVPGATGKPNTNVQAKIDALINHFESYDFFFVHFKGADSCAEDGNPIGKKEYIEKVDAVLEPVVKLAYDNKAIVSVTGDHSTSSRLKAHTADEVPIMIAGSDVRVDDVMHIGERPAQKGGLGHMDGRHLMRFLINLIGQEPLYGN